MRRFGAIFLTSKFLLIFAFMNTVHSQSLSLKDLVVETKKALLIVEEEWESPKLKLRGVELLIKVGTTVQAGGKISLWVFDIGADSKQNGASLISLKLAPPDPESGSDVSSLDLAGKLAALILSASDAVEAARVGKPELKVEELKAELVFGISAEGGLSVTLPPFNVQTGASTSSDQKITVYFFVPE